MLCSTPPLLFSHDVRLDPLIPDKAFSFIVMVCHFLERETSGPLLSYMDFDH